MQTLYNLNISEEMKILNAKYAYAVGNENDVVHFDNIVPRCHD